MTPGVGKFILAALIAILVLAQPAKAAIVEQIYLNSTFWGTPTVGGTDDWGVGALADDDVTDTAVGAAAQEFTYNSTGSQTAGTGSANLFVGHDRNDDNQNGSYFADWTSAEAGRSIGVGSELNYLTADYNISFALNYWGNATITTAPELAAACLELNGSFCGVDNRRTYLCYRVTSARAQSPTRWLGIWNTTNKVYLTFAWLKGPTLGWQTAGTLNILNISKWAWGSSCTGYSINNMRLMGKIWALTTATDKTIKLGFDNINITYLAPAVVLAPLYAKNTTPLNGLQYNSIRNHSFEVNWTQTTNPFKNVSFETNITGTLTNYSFATTPRIVIANAATTTEMYYINFTNIAAGNYSYRWFANDTDGTTNFTNGVLIYKVLQNTTPQRPLYSSNTTPLNGFQYNPLRNHSFEVNWTKGDSSIQNVSFETNITGTLKNYSFATFPKIAIINAATTTEMYYINFTGISAGNYSFRWIANSTDTKNYTDSTNFTSGVLIYKVLRNSSPQVSIGFNATSPKDYGNITAAWANFTVLQADHSATITIRRGGVNIASGAGNQTENALLGQGSNSYDAVYSESQNYSALTTSASVFTINKAATVMNFLLNGTQTNRNFTVNEYVNLTANLIANLPAGITPLVEIWTNFTTTNGWIKWNESRISSTVPYFSNYTQLTPAGIYNFSANFTNANYTTSFEAWYINVTAAPAQTFERNVTQEMTVADNSPGKSGIVRLSTNPMALTDIRTPQLTSPRISTGPIDLTDLPLRLQTIVKGPAVSIDLTEIITRVSASLRKLTNSFSLTDAVTNTVSRLFSRVSTTEISITDSITRISTALRQLTNSLSLTDSITRIFSPLRQLTNPIDLTEASSRILTPLRQLTNAIDLTEASNRIFAPLRKLTNSIGLTETTTRVYSLLRSLTNAMQLTDLTNIISTATGNLKISTLSIGLTETATGITSFTRTL
ncbi:MAG: hypothetical protein V1836_00090, partial [Candidatus Aenigmatarchaeota archaeon]